MQNCAMIFLTWLLLACCTHSSGRPCSARGRVQDADSHTIVMDWWAAGGTMSMKVCGSSGAKGTAQVGVRQGCPMSPTVFGIFFDALCHLQAECPLAGVQCRGSCIPSLFYAHNMVLLSASASFRICWILCNLFVQPAISPLASPRQRL